MSQHDTEHADHEQRIQELERRVDTLEDALESDAANGTMDHRDQALLDSFDHGDVVSGPDLVQRYRTVTDIRSSSTARERAEAITAKDCFEKEGRKWRYVGGE